MQATQLLLKALCFLFPLNLIGQIDSIKLQTAQIQLNYFIADTILSSQQRIDSTSLYVHQIAEMHRSEDNLLAWTQTFFDLAYKDIEVFFTYYDTILVQKWREPKDSLEARVLLESCYYGCYFNQANGNIYGVLRLGEYGEKLYTKFPLADFDMDGNIRTNLANCYARLGQLEKAILIHKKILNSALANKRYENYASACYSLSIPLFTQGKIKEAIAQVEEGLAYKQISSCRKGILYIALSKYHRVLGEYKEALSYALNAKEQLEVSTKACNHQVPQWQAGAYSVLGEVLYAQNKLESAEKYLLQAVSSAKTAYRTPQDRAIGKMYISLGELYIQRKQYLKAITVFNHALNTVIKHFEPKQAYQNPLSKDLFEENTIFEALTGKAYALKQLYLKAKDLKALESALACHQLAYQTEQLLRQTYQVETEKIALQGDSRTREGEAIDVLFMLYEATQNTDYLHQAFQTAEQSKSTVLLDAIQDNFLQRDIATKDSLFMQQQELKSYIARYEKTLLTAKQKDALEAQLLAFKEDLDAINKRIRAKYPNHGRQIKSEISVQDIAQMLAGKSDFLLEYFQSADYLYLFTIDANAELILERTPLNANLQADLQQFKQLASNRIAFQNAPKQFYELAYRLYEKLLPKHIKNRIENDTLVRLTIIPDGILNTCPFDALLTKSHSTGKIPFLVHKAQIDYAFSSNTLRYQQALKSPATQTMLSILPVFAAKERALAPLQYSELAAEQLHYAQSKQLLKSEATLGNFLAQFQDFRILHFSTHAQADSTNLVPSIEFIDSSLLLPEIYSLPIQADLVVLSACQTALGNARSGEGLMSLARAFAYSGSPSLLATLWKVNNKSTSELVTAFYAHLSKGKSKSEALRLAKLDYLNNNALAQQNPYYWSGMVFIGADDVVDLQKTANWWWLGIVFLLVLLLLGWRFLKA